MPLSVPKIIGHRGFKRVYPENTLLGFTQARNAGASIIELDLQVTKDSQIMICHDPSTERVFNKSKYIPNSTVEELKLLRTIRKPHESMPTFKELLLWLMKPENSSLQLMLDIKRVNHLGIFDLLHDALSVHSGFNWKSRLILGLWSEEQYKYVVDSAKFKGFQKVIITWSVLNALRLLKISDTQSNPEDCLTGISLLHFMTWNSTLWSSNDSCSSPIKTLYSDYIVDKKIDLYFWTVNHSDDMDWCLKLPFVAGIITDNPDILEKKINDLKLSRKLEPEGSDELSSIGSRRKFYSSNIKKMYLLQPYWFTQSGLRRSLYWFVLQIFIIFNKYNISKINVFGRYNIGKLLLEFSKSIGLI